MKCCEFCLADFNPRPQVKNPRACNKLVCQKLRQRRNEEEWRDKNPDYPGHEYYKINKSQRLERLQTVIRSLIKCIEVGRKLYGIEILMEEFSHILEKSILELGLREINKFWLFENQLDSADLACGLN
jgi:hypothetical protein